MIFRTLFSLLLLAPMAHAVDFRGSFTQGGMVVGQASGADKVLVDGEAVTLSKDGAFVFGFGRDRTDDVIVAIYRDQQVLDYRFAIAPRQFDIQRIDGLPPRTVTIPEEEQKRRAEERRLVGKARAPVSAMQHWRGQFIWPAKGRISGIYGSQRILNGQPRFPHYGIDIAGPEGTPILAPAAGVVTLAHPDFLLEGGIVIIDHGHGITSTLFHMSAVDVAEGQSVTQGDRIGAMGAAGRATGSHVDWRINWRSVRLDPQLLVEGTPE